MRLSFNRSAYMVYSILSKILQSHYALNFYYFTIDGYDSLRTDQTFIVLMP